MAKRREPVQLAPHSSSIYGDVAWSGLGDDPLGEMVLFAEATTPEQVSDALRIEIEREVAAILNLVADFDAFDVIELLRLRELPIVPVEGLREGYDGSGAVIDLVTLLLTTRDSRKPGGPPRQETRPHEAISELHERAMRLIRIATYAILTRAAIGPHDPLMRIAAEYQSHLVAVRSFQYESIQVKHDKELFDRPELDGLLVAKLGFTYGDFSAVRAAIQHRYSRIVTELRDTTGNLVMTAQSEGREPTEDEIEVFQNSMIDFMFLPGNRASFTCEQIAQEAQLPVERVDAVLRTFSLEFDKNVDGVAATARLLRGTNPLGRASLVRDADENYIMATVQIGTDSFRVVVETALKTDQPAWRKYDRIRTKVSEGEVGRLLASLLGTAPNHTNLKYIAPKDGFGATDLAATCSSPFLVGDQTECDSLFIVEDVAVCVEVKGRTIADAARRGDMARLRTEIRNTFGGAAEQARRLEELIEANHGLWLEGGDWLDLAEIREIRSVVVGLDFFGPLAVALGDLERSEMLSPGKLPWIASLHDLDVISGVLDRPSEFLLYIRRRSDSGVARHFRGMDELDLFMLFIEGGLYVAPDPDETRRLHPKAGPSKPRDHREYARDARPTIVATHTDQLDAWMYWLEGTSPYEVEKPVFNTDRGMQQIVNFLAQGRKPGWFRFGADLLGLAGAAQKAIVRSLNDMAKKTRQDNTWHSLVQGFAGMWGYPTLFAATWPRDHTREEAVEKLTTYMTAKKHQVQSDRSLGFVLDRDGGIVHVGYLNSASEIDGDLDQLGMAIGLSPAGYSAPPIPPSARRATRRLRGHRPAKKRRK